jgi:hypothetical protein
VCSPCKLAFPPPGLAPGLWAVTRRGPPGHALPRSIRLPERNCAQTSQTIARACSGKARRVAPRERGGGEAGSAEPHRTRIPRPPGLPQLPAPHPHPATPAAPRHSCDRDRGALPGWSSGQGGRTAISGSADRTFLSPQLPSSPAECAGFQPRARPQEGKEGPVVQSALVSHSHVRIHLSTGLLGSQTAVLCLCLGKLRI